MSPTRPIVRLATAEDLPARIAPAVLADWCIGEVVGYVAERDGVGVAWGRVTWDVRGRAWGWFDGERIGAAAMHRRALGMLVVLREVGEPALHAFCNPEIPGSEKWLRRLGFRPCPEMTEDSELPVWRCDISWEAGE